MYLVSEQIFYFSTIAVPIYRDFFIVLLSIFMERNYNALYSLTQTLY